MARIGEASAPVATRDALARGRMRASLVPDLLVEARRIVNTVIGGWHGRRKRGIGENFWQFRPYVEGEAMSRIDWRRSARDDHTYVRDREWEAAHTVWLWADPSPSMLYKSTGAIVSKESRALVLILALAELLSRSGERIAWPGLTDPVHRAQRRRAAGLASVPRRRPAGQARSFQHPPLLRHRHRQRFPRSARRDHGLARRAGAPWRARASDRGRRPGRRSLPLCRPHRILRPRDRREADRRPRRTVRDDYRTAYSARRAGADRAGASGSAGATPSTIPTGSPRKRWSVSTWR